MSENYERVHIEGATVTRIAATAEKAFAEHGFRPQADTTPQELVSEKKTPFPLRFIKGGNAVVWLVLEPRANGWDLYCVPEPAGLYPGGSSFRFRGVLDCIVAEVRHPN